MKRIYKQSLIFYFLYFCSTSLSGQGYTEIATAFTEYFPLKTGDKSFQGSRTGLNILAPLALNKEKGNYLLAGLNAETIRFGGAPESFGVDRFYGISPVFGYTGPVSDKAKITAVATPFWQSDFKKKEGNAARFAGFVRFARQVNESFTWRVTAGYRHQYFGPQYILLLGMDWKAGERWRFFGDLPQNFTVSYKLHERICTGLGFLANVTSYNITGQGRYFRYIYAHAGPFLEFSLLKNLILRGDADYSFIRKYEVYDDGSRPDATLILFQLGSKPVPLSSPLDKGLVLRATASYRVSND